MADTKDNELDFPNWLKALGGIILAVAAIVILTYVISFASLGVGNQEQFGQFGDYIGGLLNPILSFFTIFLLLWSIRLQSKELKLTRIEIENSNKELANSAEALAQTLKAHEDQYQLSVREAARAQVYDTLNYHYKEYMSSYQRQVLRISGAHVSIESMLNNDDYSRNSSVKRTLESLPEMMKDEIIDNVTLTVQRMLVESAKIANATHELYQLVESRSVAISWYDRANETLAVLYDDLNVMDDEAYHTLRSSIALPEKFNNTPPRTPM